MRSIISIVAESLAQLRAIVVMAIIGGNCWSRTAILKLVAMKTIYDCKVRQVHVDSIFIVHEVADGVRSFRFVTSFLKWEISKVFIFRKMPDMRKLTDVVIGKVQSF